MAHRLLLEKILVENLDGQPYGKGAHSHHRHKNEEEIGHLDPYGVGIDDKLSVTTEADESKLLLQQA